MTYPFQWLSPILQWVALVLSLVGTLFFAKKLDTQGASLKNDVAPYNIVSLELAWNGARSQEIIDSWNITGLQDTAKKQLHLDFAFIVFYPIFLSLSCAILSRHVSDMLTLIGVVLTWSALAAGILDVVENVLIFHMIESGVTNLVSRLTTLSAGLKFALIFSVFGYWFVSLLQWILSVLQSFGK